MPKAQVVEETEYRHEEGWQTATLISVNEREVEYFLKAHHAAVKNGEKRVGDKASFWQWRWAFKIKGGPYNGDELNVDTDAKISSREDSKARIISETFLGRALEVGEGVDTDLFIGQDIQIHLYHREPVEKKDGTKGYYSDVDDFAPAGTQAASPYESSTYDDTPPF